MATLPRADHVGSFLRPPELFEARHAFNEGKITREQLSEAEDAAVLKVLDLQRQAGLEIFSDGEYRRNIYSGAFDESFDGLAPNPDALPNQGIAWQGPNVEGVNAAIQGTAAPAHRRVEARAEEAPGRRRSRVLASACSRAVEADAHTTQRPPALEGRHHRYVLRNGGRPSDRDGRGVPERDSAPGAGRLQLHSARL